MRCVEKEIPPGRGRRVRRTLGQRAQCPNSRPSRLLRSPRHGRRNAVCGEKIVKLRSAAAGCKLVPRGERRRRRDGRNERIGENRRLAARCLRLEACSRRIWGGRMGDDSDGALPRQSRRARRRLRRRARSRRRRAVCCCTGAKVTHGRRGGRGTGWRLTQRPRAEPRRQPRRAPRPERAERARLTSGHGETAAGLGWMCPTARVVAWEARGRHYHGSHWGERQDPAAEARGRCRRPLGRRRCAGCSCTQPGARSCPYCKPRRRRRASSCLQ
eukprot:scaffold15964_cov135-Isochrysis_galbana.AAC.6